MRSLCVSVGLVAVAGALAFACGGSDGDGIADDGADASTTAPTPSGTVTPTPGGGDDGGSTDEDAAAPDKDAGSDAATGGDGGDKTLNTGDTSGQQATAGHPGAPCKKDGDCINVGGENPQDAFCLKDSDGFPGGYCSFFTDNSLALNYGCNATKDRHVALSKGFGDGYCAHDCTQPNDCRVGYRCVDRACQPNCAVPDYNCWMGTCSTADKVCAP